MYPTKKPPIPLAPAPARLGVSTASTSSAKVGVNAPTDELSTSSDEDLQLVAGATSQAKHQTASSTGLYAELDGSGGEEFEVEEHIADDEQITDRDELIRERIAASQEQMKNILSNLSAEQLQRYETFRRVGFPRPMIKKVMTRVLENLGAASAFSTSAKDKAAAANLNPSTVIVISGIAKVFVGELIEEARVIQEEWADEGKGPLTPSHILEAQRRLKANFSLPTSCNHKRRSNFLL